jgi:hypothetical protein
LGKLFCEVEKSSSYGVEVGIAMNGIIAITITIVDESSIIDAVYDIFNQSFQQKGWLALSLQVSGDILS